MNLLIEKGEICEKNSGSNFSYILSNNDLFLSTEYKVLQNSHIDSLVKSMKILYNGKVQLYYITKDLIPFSTMISSLDSNGFISIVSNLIGAIIELKNNGFLMCEKIDISFERIYVDVNTYKVYLVYLPVKNKLFDQYNSFENYIRTELVRIISNNSTLQSPKTRQLAEHLSNGTVSIENLFSRIKGVSSQKISKSMENQKLCLKEVNGKADLIINKAEYKIGRNPSMVDGLITFNKMIGRIHCTIIKNLDEYSIVDLQSSNGTYVNGVKLQPNQPCTIKEGDLIRLANSNFNVNFE